MRVGEVNRFYGKKVHFPDKNAGQEYRKNTVAAIRGGKCNENAEKRTTFPPPHEREFS